jgi:hypothetical protein
MYSSVNKVIGYELEDQGSTPGSGRDYSVGYYVQTGFGVHTVSYPVSTETISIGIKRLQRETLILTFAEVKNLR